MKSTEKSTGKVILIIGDGMSDQRLERLGGKSPLMVARKPHIDRVAREGRVGLFQSIPAGQPSGSAVANLSVLGYDPVQCFQGRAVLEAASMGVEIGPKDFALRCNVIYLKGDRIGNHSAGHISTAEGTELIRALDAELGGGRGELPVRFHPGIAYRHLLVLEDGWASPDFDCSPPHDHLGERVAGLMPKATSPAGETTVARLLDLHERAEALLASHPINLARIAAGKDPANAIWPWSGGMRPQMATLQERFSAAGSVISAVDLVRGLGRLSGMEIIEVEGATGLWDTNYEGKVEAALDAIAEKDIVYLHIEAPDEAGHAMDLDLKIRCIEDLDSRVVGPVLAGLAERGIGARVAVLPDHPTYVTNGAHGNEAVPVALFGPGVEPDAVQAYDEASCAEGGFGLLEGEDFIRAALAVA